MASIWGPLHKRTSTYLWTPVPLYKMTIPYLHPVPMSNLPLPDGLDLGPGHPYNQHPLHKRTSTYLWTPVPLYKMTIPYLHPVPRNHPDGDLHWIYPLVPAFFKNLEES